MKNQTLILQKYYGQARLAHNWISVNPEERAAENIKFYSQELEADLAALPPEERERYQSNYEARFLAFLQAKGRCMSSLITGRANFNNRRAEKASERETHVYIEFREWRDRAQKAIKQKQEQAIPLDVRNQKVIQKFKADIDYIKQSSENNEAFYKSLFVSNLAGRLITVAKAGNVEVLEAVIPYALEQGIITARHRINKLPEFARKIADTAQKDSQTTKFDGGELTVNYQIERVQILFAEIPSAEMRSELKSNGFHWSPRYKAWQRKNTLQGINAAKRILKI